MRMWMCNPRILCRKHLLGEYRELFTFLGTLKQQKRLDGYFKNNLLEPLALESRYKKLKDEMLFRKYKPKKEFIFNNTILDYLNDKKYNKINKNKSLKELIKRCPECKQRYDKYKYSHLSWNIGLKKDNNLILNKISKQMKKKYKLGTAKYGFKKGHFQIGNPSWNTGLTKETSIKLKNIGSKISLTYKYKRKEEKEKLRKQARRITVERISKFPNKYKTNTKPEIKFKEILKSLHIEYKHNYPIFSIEHSYPSDFYLPKYNTIIEIDGVYWHNWPYGNKIDDIRNNELAEKNINIIRLWDTELDFLDGNVLLEELENLNINARKNKT